MFESLCNVFFTTGTLHSGEDASITWKGPHFVVESPAALSQITQYHDFFNKKGLYSRKSDESSFNYTLTQDPTANPESNLTNAETAGDPTTTN